MKNQDLKQWSRVKQLAYVTYVRMPTFISGHMFWTCIRWHLYSFFPYGFSKFSKFSGSYNILYKNLLLWIWPVIYFFVLGRDRFFTVYICFKETLFFSLPQSTCQFRVTVRKWAIIITCMYVIFMILLQNYEKTTCAQL